MTYITREAQTHKTIDGGTNINAVPVSVILEQDAGATADTARGTALGIVTASGKYREYDDSGSDGEEVLRCILRDNVSQADRIAGNVTVAVNLPQRLVYPKAQLVGVDANGLADVGGYEFKGATTDYYVI